MSSLCQGPAPHLLEALQAMLLLIRSMTSRASICQPKRTVCVNKKRTKHTCTHILRHTRWRVAFVAIAEPAVHWSATHTTRHLPTKPPQLTHIRVDPQQRHIHTCLRKLVAPRMQQHSSPPPSSSTSGRRPSHQARPSPPLSPVIATGPTPPTLPPNGSPPRGPAVAARGQGGGGKRQAQGGAELVKSPEALQRAGEGLHLGLQALLLLQEALARGVKRLGLGRHLVLLFGCGCGCCSVVIVVVVVMNEGVVVVVVVVLLLLLLQIFYCFCGCRKCYEHFVSTPLPTQKKIKPAGWAAVESR